MTLKKKHSEALRLAAEHDGGVLATDDGLRGCVVIHHQDGSTFFYNYAYMRRIVVEGTAFIAVFSEHNGYAIFHQDDLARYRQYLNSNERIEDL